MVVRLSELSQNIGLLERCTGHYHVQMAYRQLLSLGVLFSTPSLFWVVTQRVVVAVYRLLATPNWSQLHDISQFHLLPSVSSSILQFSDLFLFLFQLNITVVAAVNFVVFCFFFFSVALFFPARKTHFPHYIFICDLYSCTLILLSSAFSSSL